MQITDDKLRNLAKSIYDVGKLTFGALVLGSLLSPSPFKLKYFLGGYDILYSLFCHRLHARQIGGCYGRPNLASFWWFIIYFDIWSISLFSEKTSTDSLTC